MILGFVGKDVLTDSADVITPASEDDIAAVQKQRDTHRAFAEAYYCDEFTKLLVQVFKQIIDQLSN